MKDVNEFLAHSIRLEEEAAARFGDLATIMNSYGNDDVACLFQRLGDFSAQHAQVARSRGGFHDLPKLKYSLNFDGPESTSMEGSHYLMTVDYAIGLVLESERAGYEFYQSIANSTNDPEIRIMAREFADEEADHVAELERWLLKKAS